MKTSIFTITFIFLLGCQISWAQTTVSAKLIQGAECVLVQAVESNEVLHPCTTPQGWENLQVGDSVTITYTPGSCISICMQGTDIEISTFELLEPSAGIESNNNLLSELKIYPQPISDQFTVESDFMIESIRIFNFQGKLLIDEQINTKSFVLPCSSVSTGIYLLELKTEKGIKVQQIVKK